MFNNTWCHEEVTQDNTGKVKAIPTDSCHPYWTGHIYQTVTEGWLLTTENMQIQRTLGQYTVESATLQHRWSHLPRRKQPQLDQQLSRLMSYKPTIPQLCSSSQTYSTRITDPAWHSISTIHRRMELRRLMTTNQISAGNSQLNSPSETNSTTTSVSIVASPTDSAQVMACCPLFLP